MKKISIALCLFFMSFSLQAQALGDVNESGNIDIIDALIIAQYYVNIRINYCNLNVADVNCDNRIDIVDALLVTQYYLEIISVFSCSATPTPTPTPVPTETPEPTDPPGTGEVMINPEITSASSGERVMIGIKVNSGLHGYYHFEFGVFFDSSLLTVDSGNFNNGVGAVDDTFISSVEVSNSFIRIIGERIADEPYTWNSFYIFWNTSPDKGGTSLLDLVVYDLSDADNRTIGYPVGIPGYVEVTYVAPTPDPTATPTETPDPTETPIPTPDPTPSPMPENLTVDLELPTSASWGGTNHWIPNTGEAFGPFCIKVTAESSAGGNFAFTGDFETLDILPPLDDNFDSSETGDSNIKTNKGKCQYYLYAWQTNENPQLLKIFQLNSGIMNSAARYETVFSATGADLKVGTGGYIYYDYNGTIYNYFTINAETGTGTIRPGDDLRLRFGLVYYPEFNEKVGDEGFLAIYDKKLLWRANLYIDEGANDWNNLNPWTAAKGNVWDTIGNGGQIAIHSFTDIFNNQVDDAVGYSYGCTDTPVFFNFELEEQRSARRAESGNPALQETIAANNNWDNGYLFTLDLEHPYDPLNINDNNYYPYKPGYSSREYVNGTYTSNHTCYSAGIECQGLIMRAAGYAGNPYTDLYAIPENERMVWGTYVAKNLPGTGNWEAISWGITTYNDEQTSLVVPGDIIRIAGHLGIVAKVNYDENRVAGLGDIIIMEAYGRNMQVYKERTWGDFKSDDDEHKLCTIRRLIQ